MQVSVFVRGPRLVGSFELQDVQRQREKKGKLREDKDEDERKPPRFCQGICLYCVVTKPSQKGYFDPISAH